MKRVGAYTSTERTTGVRFGMLMARETRPSSSALTISKPSLNFILYFVLILVNG